MTIKEIDKQIAELKCKRRTLELQERNEFLKHAQANVGRCFKSNGVYAKVIGVPKVTSCITGDLFNKYQYPAIYLNLSTDEIPFVIDTLYSGAWGEGCEPRCEEITQEEFNTKFDEAIKEFSNRIKGENNEA